MSQQSIKTIFYEKSLFKDNKNKLNSVTVITLLLAAVSLIVLFYILFYNDTFISFCCRSERQLIESTIEEPHAAPSSITEIQNLLLNTTIKCRSWEVFEPAELEEGEKIEGRWREGTSLCLDNFPSHPTPSSCRIYATSFDQDDVQFEIQMGNNGCRVHFWGNKTTFNYSKVAKNAYLYPLEIGTTSGDAAVYSYDDFLDLLGHKKLPIHLLKSNLPGGEWKVIKSLTASKIKAWTKVKQVRLLVHLPRVTHQNWIQLEEPYINLVGLKNLGFQLARSRMDPRYTYRLPGFKEPLSLIYELVWIR